MQQRQKFQHICLCVKTDDLIAIVLDHVETDRSLQTKIGWYFLVDFAWFRVSLLADRCTVVSMKTNAMAYGISECKIGVILIFQAYFIDHLDFLNIWNYSLCCIRANMSTAATIKTLFRFSSLAWIGGRPSIFLYFQSTRCVQSDCKPKNIFGDRPKWIISIGSVLEHQ